MTPDALDHMIQSAGWFMVVDRFMLVSLLIVSMTGWIAFAGAVITMNVKEIPARIVYDKPRRDVIDAEHSKPLPLLPVRPIPIPIHPPTPLRPSTVPARPYHEQTTMGMGNTRTQPYTYPGPSWQPEDQTKTGSQTKVSGGEFVKTAGGFTWTGKMPRPGWHQED